MEHWQGAQWVLVTLLTIRTVLPVLLRLGDMDGFTRTNTTWAGAYIGKRVIDASLVLLLVWGGFWT